MDDNTKSRINSLRHKIKNLLFRENAGDANPQSQNETLSVTDNKNILTLNVDSSGIDESESNFSLNRAQTISFQQVSIPSQLITFPQGFKTQKNTTKQIQNKKPLKLRKRTKSMFETYATN